MCDSGLGERRHAHEPPTRSGPSWREAAVRVGDTRLGRESPAAFAATVCELKLPFLLYYRRNVLRRLVSNAVNKLAIAAAAAAGGDHKSTTHPKSDKTIAALAAIRPRLNTSTLVREIDAELEDRTSLVRVLERHSAAFGASMLAS